MSWIGKTIGGAVEGAISVVSPRHAARRAHLRRMADSPEYAQTFFALMRSRGYKAAETGRNSGTWLGSGGSGDAELSNDLAAMRNRSRELDRDDSLAGGIFGTMVNNIVGRELRPQSKTGDREKNRRLESIWRDRRRDLFPAEGVSIGRVQRRLCHRKMVDGDVFVKLAKTSADEPVWFEVIEGDRVQTPLSAKPATGGRIQDGIEKDQYGRPVAIHVLKRHPGDPLNPGMVMRPEDFARVPASSCWQTLRGERGGVTRGEPLLHAVLQDVRDLDLLMLASIKRCQIAACLAVFVESEAKLDEMFDVTAQQYGMRLDQDIEPGMVYKLFPGEKVSTLLPNMQIPELVPFIMSLASRIGAAIGLTWQYILKDFHADTYSSARTAQLACEPTWDIEQRDQIDDIWTPVWIAVMQDARLRGDPRMDGITDADVAFVQWQGDGRKWVDPSNQAEAKRIARKLGIETMQSQCAEVGQDWEDNLDAMADLAKECAARGMSEDQIDQIVFGQEPSKTNPNNRPSAEPAKAPAPARAAPVAAVLLPRVPDLEAVI